MISERVKQLRTELGIGAETLAHATGIPRATIADIEDGILLRPPKSAIKALADAFGVTPADLMAGRNQAMINAGWWPPELVRLVVDKIHALSHRPPYEGGHIANGLSVEFQMRFALLRHAAGIEVPEALVREARSYLAKLQQDRPTPAGDCFPIRLDTPAQAREFVVRYRSDPDKNSTFE